MVLICVKVFSHVSLVRHVIDISTSSALVALPFGLACSHQARYVALFQATRY